RGVPPTPRTVPLDALSAVLRRPVVRGDRRAPRDPRRHRALARDDGTPSTARRVRAEVIGEAGWRALLVDFFDGQCGAVERDQAVATDVDVDRTIRCDLEVETLHHRADR